MSKTSLSKLLSDAAEMTLPAIELDIQPRGDDFHALFRRRPPGNVKPRRRARLPPARFRLFSFQRIRALPRLAQRYRCDPSP